MDSQGIILVIDDNYADLKLLGGILTEAGYQVRPADSGELGLTAVAASPPDLILLDIRMPGLDGFEVCRRLKEREESAKIPIIFLSAATEAEERVRGLQLGAVDFIAKPFQREELLVRVQTQVRLSRLQTQLEHRAAELERANAQLQIEMAQRQQVEASVRQQEVTLRSILRAAPIGIGLVTRRIFGWVNDQLSGMTGYAAEELLGQSARMLYESDAEFERVGRVKYEVIKQQGTGSIETRWRRKDGAAMDIFLSSTPLDPRNLDGGIVFTAMDITRRKEAETELLLKEQLLDGASDSIFLHDLDGHFLYVNEAAYQNRGYGKEELLAKDVSALVAPEFVGVRAALLNDLLAKGDIIFESAHRRQDGSVMPVEIHARVIDQGDRRLILSAARDITERQQAERARRESEERFQYISSTISDISYSCRKTPDGGYALDWMGGATDGITGYSVEEIKARRCWRFLVLEDDLPLFDAHVTGLAAGSSDTCELRLRHKDGGLVWVASFARCVRKNESPDRLRLYGGLVDITERKRAEAEITLNKARMASLMEISQYPATSIQELLDYALEETIALTGSKIGYIYFYDETTRQFTLNTWSRDVMQECTITEPQTIYQLEKTGIWGEAVRQARPIVVNDFQAPHPLKKGYPEGHAKLYKYLTVPILSNQRIVAVAAVANKATDYDDADVRQLTLMMDAVWKIVERQKAVQDLRESEEKYRAMVETAQEGVWIIDAEARNSYVNPRLAEMLGYSEQELLGRSLFDFMDDAAREEMAKRLARRRQGIAETYDFRFRRQDGSPLWAIVAATPFLDPQGKHLGSLGMITDITARKQAEALLQVERDQAQLYLDTAGVAFIALDAAGAITLINKKGCEILGYAEQELLGQDWFAVCLPPAVTQEVRGVFNQLMAGDIEPVEYYENPVVTKTGEQRIIAFHNRVIRDQSSRIISILCSGEDITARRQAEEELRTAAQRWQITFDAIGDAVFLLERDCRITQCNQAAADLVGRPGSEIIGSTCWELLHGGDGPIAACPLMRVGESRQRETLTLPFGDRWLYAVVDPIFSETGELTGAVHSISDITNVKRAEEKLKYLNTLLQVITEINEALLRVQGESELFQQTCDLLLGVPYVKFSWIGLVQPDSREIKPVAWAGAEEGYLAIIKVAWDDSEYGRGPTGQAIKTGQPIVRKNLAPDPYPHPWKEEALKRGFHSSITLPLVFEHEVIGILKAYAGVPDAFGEREIEFLNQVAGDIAVGVKSLRLEKGLQQSLTQMQTIIQQTVETLAAMAELRDPYTAGHQQGVTQLAMALGTAMGLSEDRLAGLRKAGFLHDIGKIAVPSDILSKPGKISGHEMQIIRTHSQVGHDILQKIDFPWPVAQIVLQHHERLNGSGYPQGLHGPDILLEARILAVADVVEAMASHRPYRPALGIEAALEEITRNKGILYDPEVVEACVNLFQEGGFAFATLSGGLPRLSA